MYLSSTARDEGYAPLQAAIAAVIGGGKPGAVNPGDYEFIRKKCSE